MGILIGAIVALCALGASISAYLVWYSNPDKMLADGIVAILTTDNIHVSGKGRQTLVRLQKPNENVADDALKNQQQSSDVTLDYSRKDRKTKANLNLTATLPQNLTAKIKGTMLTMENGDHYIKIENPQELVNTYILPQLDRGLLEARSGLVADGTEAEVSLRRQLQEALVDSIKENLQKVADTAKGKWISIPRNAKVTSTVQGAPSELLCIDRVIRKLQTDTSTGKNLVKLFRRHQFLTVDTSVAVEPRGGSDGYRVVLKRDKLNRFYEEAAKGTDTKEVIDCLKETVDSVADVAKDNKARRPSDAKFNVWIDRWTHYIRAVSIESSLSRTTKGVVGMLGNSRMDIKIDYDAIQAIDRPKDEDVITLEEVKKSAPLISDMLQV